jgi:sensor histidine kinase YesM
MKNSKKILEISKQSLAHLLFWIGVLLFFTLVLGVNNNLDSNVLYFSMFLMPVTIATTYTSIYKLIPDYLIPKHYYHFSLYSLYTLIISIFGILFSIFIAYAYFTNIENNSLSNIGKSALFIIACIYLVVILVSAFKLLKINLKQSKENAKLEAIILEAKLKLKEQELKYLKMQIHPHFLFNTLNTMYGFAIKKADETPEMILKLSNLLDYLLYQVDKPFVSLTDEIHHIEDYISLEKMRFADTLNVNFTKHIHSSSIKVAPMIFIPFVENSFKHGTIIDGVLTIDVNVETKPNSILFTIKNSYSKDSEYNEGIGLENIKKRLELLYPNRYKLQILNNDKEFSVNLQLQLND